MDSSNDHILLVRKARQGDKESLDRLAEAASVRLGEYVGRLMVGEAAAEDIVQESILEMYPCFQYNGHQARHVLYPDSQSGP